MSDKNIDLNASRDMPDLNKSGKSNSVFKMILIILAIIFTGAIITFVFGDNDDKTQEQSQIRTEGESRPQLNLSNLNEKKLVQVAPAPEPINLATTEERNESKEPEISQTILNRKMASLALVYSKKNVVDASAALEKPDVNPEDSLKESPLEITKVRQNINQSYLLSKGTYIDCTLENAMQSDINGPVSCVVSSDVYSANGRYRLIDAGAKISGEYKANLTHGKSRLFVLWNRIQTTDGYIVKIHAPGTDALGRAGVTGHIQTHFWKRFGGSILLLIVGDVFATVAARSSDRVAITDNTEDGLKNAAAIAMEHTINIRPTLNKEQGGHIKIFVSRDIDFKPLIYGK